MPEGDRNGDACRRGPREKRDPPAKLLGGCCRVLEKALQHKSANARQAALDLASQLVRAPPWLRDREGESSKPFVATSARWALAASLRKALLEEENGSDPIIRQAALRCAVSALKRATPATLDVLLAHQQLPRASRRGSPATTPCCEGFGAVPGAALERPLEAAVALPRCHCR